MNFTHHGCVASLQLHIVMQLRFPVQAGFIKSHRLKLSATKDTFATLYNPAHNHIPRQLLNL